MRADILSFMRQHHMSGKMSEIIAAVSGGADSMALLHCLWGLRDILEVQIRAVHVHHGIRGEEAWRDLRCVQELCGGLEIPLEAVFIDVPAQAKRTGESLEQCARRLRYDALNGLAQRSGAFIATAHTADDQAETVLLRMLRGTGLNGLTGIQPVLGRVIRPMLDVTRQDVERYCKDCRLDYVTDSSNLEEAFQRNRLRWQVLPVLKNMNPAFLSTVSKLTRHLAEDRAYLDSQTERAMAASRMEKGYCAAMLSSLPDALRHRALLQIGAEQGLALEEPHIRALDALLRGERRAAGLPKGFQAAVSGQNEFFLFQPVPQAEPVQFIVKPDDNLNFLGRKLSITTINMAQIYKNGIVNKKLFIKAVDYDRIHGDIIVRNRREGDAIALAGRSGTKTLKKLCNEYKVGREARSRLAVLADDDGVFFVEGFGPARRAAVTEGTVNALAISIEGEKEGER